MIEVRYAGAVVGRSAIVRELDTRGLFLGTTEPMPVGTLVTLKVGEHAVEGKVASVAESQELARAGMRVRFADPASATLFGTPGAAPEPEAPPELAPVKASGPVQVVSQAVPQELSGAVPASGQVITSAPRRIVVDASTESAAVAAPVAADEVEASGQVPAAGAPAEPPGPGEGGKKNRRNKRR